MNAFHSPSLLPNTASILTALGDIWGTDSTTARPIGGRDSRIGDGSGT